MNYIGVQASDILLNESDEIQVVDGDFAVTTSQVVGQKNSLIMLNNCDNRVATDVLKSSSGIWYRTPLLGVNLYKWINAPMTAHNRDVIGQSIRNGLILGGYFNVIQATMDENMNFKIIAQRQKA